MADDVAAADVVVVGAGAAGLVAALHLAPLRVTVLTKTAAHAGGATPLAQGGLAAAVGPDDDPVRHAADSITASGRLADAAVVEAFTAAAPRVVRVLAGIGVRFDTCPDGSLRLGREAGHSRRRILHARDDATGAELARALLAGVEAAPTITLVRHASARRITIDRGRATGVVARHADGALVLHAAPVVVLATGGIGALYARTTNPPEATGDGLALAARAGARLADLEFVQFHPTALAAGGAQRLGLLSEALRGEGARLVDADGRPALPSDLAPRDVVARAIWERERAGSRTYLDARRVCARPGAFPTLRRLCRVRRLDPATDLLPVTPAAHYHMGGVATDCNGRTSLPGLWACGEVACTGMHGANRLAGNSLLEAVVTGLRVAADARRVVPGRVTPVAREAVVDADADPLVPLEVGQLLWEHVGVVRDEAGLTACLDKLAALSDEVGPGDGEAHNGLLVARLIATAALRRRESRGAHFRSDHPAPDPRWQVRQPTTSPELEEVA